VQQLRFKQSMYHALHQIVPGDVALALSLVPHSFPQLHAGFQVLCMETSISSGSLQGDCDGLLAVGSAMLWDELTVA
jgi:hypothetical protein